MSAKARSVTLLVIAEIAGMSLWFTSAAVLPDMVAEGDIADYRQALMSTGVQAGFRDVPRKTITITHAVVEKPSQ